MTVAIQPIVIEVDKPGRGRVKVAKLTHFLGEDEPILAVAWKRQQGTRNVISLPVRVVEWAWKSQGVEWLYWGLLRAPQEMRRISLDAVRLNGWQRKDGEVYLPLSALQPVEFKEWAFAWETVLL